MSDFEKVVTALWDRLKLGTPRFGATPMVTLSIDGLDVRLEEAADGRHLIVAGTAGRLAPDVHRREEQVRQLLRVNLGMLQGNRAGVSLDESAGAAAAVRVQAVYPYAANRIDDLVRLIEDVLQRLELHAGDLAAGPVQRPAAVAPAGLSWQEENVIFRP